MHVEEELIAPFLVLLLGKLTHWNLPPKGGGDPVYLTAEQKSALAAEGIRLLSGYLAPEAAKQVMSAIGPMPARPRGTAEDMLLSAGELGAIRHLPGSHGGNGAPGCCVMINGQLVCVR